MADKEMHCSFCGKSQHDVAKLIAGPGVNVCSECVSLCSDICTDAGVVGFKPPSGQALRKWSIEQAASFAGGNHEELLRIATAMEAHVVGSDRSPAPAAAAPAGSIA